MNTARQAWLCSCLVIYPILFSNLRFCLLQNTVTYCCCMAFAQRKGMIKNLSNNGGSEKLYATYCFTFKIWLLHVDKWLVLKRLFTCFANHMRELLTLEQEKLRQLHHQCSMLLECSASQYLYQTFTFTPALGANKWIFFFNWLNEIFADKPNWR